MRNFAILNIVASEAKIFQTKERAPLLLCIEVYRPIEMTLDDPTELYKTPEYRQMQEGSISGMDDESIRLLR